MLGRSDGEPADLDLNGGPVVWFSLPHPRDQTAPRSPEKAVPPHLNLPRVELPPPRAPKMQLVLEVPGGVRGGRFPPGVFRDAAPGGGVHDPSRGVQWVGLDEAVWYGVEFLGMSGVYETWFGKISTREVEEVHREQAEAFCRFVVWSGGKK